MHFSFYFEMLNVAALRMKLKWNFNAKMPIKTTSFWMFLLCAFHTRGAQYLLWFVRNSYADLLGFVSIFFFCTQNICSIFFICFQKLVPHTKSFVLFHFFWLSFKYQSVKIIRISAFIHKKVREFNLKKSLRVFAHRQKDAFIILHYIGWIFFEFLGCFSLFHSSSHIHNNFHIEFIKLARSLFIRTKKRTNIEKD